MDQLLPELYTLYGKYINEFRSFPSILDGCKLVERRLLYCVYDVARQNKVKAARVVGDCIGKFHPHSDQSAYGSLVQLVQNGFVEGQGNWGSNIGITSAPAAAMRYTECKAKKNTLDMAFEFINSIPKVDKEMDPEPAFLPTKLPFCLLGNSYTQGIGFGFKTYIPAYEEKDLVKRLSWLLGYRKTEPVIKPKTNCKILSNDVDLKNLLTTGKGKIVYKGNYTLELKTNSILIHSVPEGKSFLTFLKKFEKQIQSEKSIGFVDESEKGNTNVRLKILRQRGYPLSALKDQVDKELTGSVSFECNMCDLQGKVVLVSVDKMLLDIYKVYKNVIKGVITEDIKDIDNKINELNIIKTILPELSKELKTNPDDITKVINNISVVCSISVEILKAIFEKYTIGRLFRIKTETVDLKVSKKLKQENLKNLEDYVWKEKYL